MVVDCKGVDQVVGSQNTEQRSLGANKQPSFQAAASASRATFVVYIWPTHTEKLTEYYSGEQNCPVT